MIIISGLAGIIMLGRVPVAFTAKEPAQIVGKGNTHSMQLSINGRTAFDGGYKKIPMALRLPPGRHVVTARRDGYYSDQKQIDIRSGTVLEEVMFNLKPKVEFARVGISANWATSPIVVVNINDGYYVTRISSGSDVPGTTAMVPDLQSGKEYNVVAAIAEDGMRKDVSCRFTPTRLPQGRFTLLHIDFVTRNCTVFIR